MRLRRMMLGMSQEKLGELLGLTFQQVQKYEKGANRIGASRLYQLAQILDVPVQFFFEDMPGEAPPPMGFSESDPTTMVTGFLSSAEGVQLNRYFARIEDARLRRRILELVKTLAGEDAEVTAG